MTQLTDQQINTIVSHVAEALRAALKDVAGINPQDEKKNRQKARILAALARSGDLIASHRHLEPILRHQAMTKTMLRRALGGNAVKIDDALDELVSEGTVRHHASHRLLHKAASLYQLVQQQPTQNPPVDSDEPPPRDTQDDDRRMKEIWDAACSAPLMPSKKDDDQPRNPNLPDGAYQDLQNPKSHVWRLPKI